MDLPDSKKLLEDNKETSDVEDEEDDSQSYKPIANDKALTIGAVENATNAALALTRVSNLGRKADTELDELSATALKAYEDIMDLGMNVEPRFSARLFEVATNLLKTSLDAKTAKIDKNLKIVDLQLKKQKLDTPPPTKSAYVPKKDRDKKEEKRDVIITDRNTLMQQLKGTMDKSSEEDK